MSAAFGDPRLPERFWSKVEPEPNTGCWLWAGGSRGKLVGGLPTYGEFRWDDTMKLAHRVAYEVLVGQVQRELVLDHRCNMPCCVSPNHLRPITNRENILRGTGRGAIHARGTVCPRGHAYDILNGRNWRGCRTCKNTAECERKRKQRAAHRLFILSGEGK